MSARLMSTQRLTALVLTSAIWSGANAWAQQPPPPAATRSRAAILRDRAETSVMEAKDQRAKGGFVGARASLEAGLTDCGDDLEGLDCRTIVASSLGSLLQHQASADLPRSAALTREAVGYYDRVLKEVPNHPDALYGKALAYRALGPTEGEGAFYAQAAARDTARRAVYSSFEGDYFVANRRWPEAVDAYRRALNADQDDEGAQSGLIESLGAQGPGAATDLLRLGREWEIRYPSSAASAYGAALVSAFGPGVRRNAIADSALLGLVSVQARNGRKIGEVPAGVPEEWSPPRELRAFVDNPTRATVPWWSLNLERRRVLAQAALAQGRQVSGEGKFQAAERIWQSAARAVEPTSSASLDLQRELAVLYFQRPALDPDGRKFSTLEHQIFEGKFGALATGDLEAAQRYHTTLGLIYAERGVWQSDNYARNAEQQLTWALDKAEERERREGFYQPLPELRQLLASRPGPGAARRYAGAANAYLDTDELVAAEAAVRSSGLLNNLLILRNRLALGGPGAASSCAPESLARLQTLSDRRFATRQRFKVLADCMPVQAVANRRRHAIDAFSLVDTSRITLVGMADVARFERVVTAIIGTGDGAYHAGHLEAALTRGELSIPVALPGETKPLWLGVKPALRERLREQAKAALP